MMTDNEKRAHDLAIAYVSALLAHDGSENPSFYDEYIDMYNSFLDRLNKDFPG